MRAVFSRIGSRISCGANAFHVSLICAALIGRRVFVCWAALAAVVFVWKTLSARSFGEPAAVTEIPFVQGPPPDFVFHPPRGFHPAEPPDVSRLVASMRGAIVGRTETLEALAIAVLADGHALLEGAPGLAKTLACRTLAHAIGGTFARVQCNADLAPADVTGSEIFDPRDLSFRVRLGPVCANVVLADEINRAPARAQSAFFEAMEERELTIGAITHVLPRPFTLLATMNEAEPDGIYALPRAQLDRFLLKVVLDFPDPADELAILEQTDKRRRSHAEPAAAPQATILSWQAAVRSVYCAPRLKEHIVALVRATRDASANAGLEYGAGPRASVALLQVARARAVLNGRPYVIPADLDATAADVLRHRIAFPNEFLLSRAERARGLRTILERVRIA